MPLSTLVSRSIHITSILSHVQFRQEMLLIKMMQLKILDTVLLLLLRNRESCLRTFRLLHSLFQSCSQYAHPTILPLETRFD